MQGKANNVNDSFLHVCQKGVIHLAMPGFSLQWAIRQKLFMARAIKQFSQIICHLTRRKFVVKFVERAIGNEGLDRFRLGLNLFPFFGSEKFGNVWVPGNIEKAMYATEIMAKYPVRLIEP